MVMGGVEKELITILNKLDYSQYDVTVLLAYVEDKSIVDAIPKNVTVKILNLDKGYFFSGVQGLVTTRIKKGRIIEALKILCGRTLFKKPCSEIISFKNVQCLDEQFDYAVCYHMHSSFMLRYVDEKVKAKRKIVWIHNDFSSTGFKVERYKKRLSGYDKYIAVSKRVREEFVERLPEFSEKTEVVHNYLNAEDIVSLAKQKTDSASFDNDGNTKLVTVGRICSQKGYDLAAYACKKIIADGFNITWYMIGGGDDTEIKQLIERLHIKDNFILLGRKDNPYPYVKAADLYVQPSRHEALCLTVNEARILGKVVICTDFAGADEQVVDGYDGIIVKAFTHEDIALTIEKVLGDKERFLQLKDNAEKTNEQGEKEWQKILSVFEDIK